MTLLQHAASSASVDWKSEDEIHPAGWWLSMRWLDLLFAHWPVKIENLKPLVPPGLEIDRYDGQAWVGIVPFRMTRIHARGMAPIAGFRAFAETNLRTYVTCRGKPGVFFISLDAPHLPAVITARALFHLPYIHSKVTSAHDNEWIQDTTIRNSRTKFIARYRPIGPITSALPGSLEHFLTERYCLFARGRRGGIVTAKIHHDPWPLQIAEAGIEYNTLAAAHGIELPNVKPLLHFSRYVHAVAWMPKTT